MAAEVAAGKLAEVPLASIGDEWSEFSDFQCHSGAKSEPSRVNRGSYESEEEPDEEPQAPPAGDEEHDEDDDDQLGHYEEAGPTSETRPASGGGGGKERPGVCDSLEELVNTFDEKIVHCFSDYEQSVEQLAPVQILAQEELIQECQ